jgi:hypothetical protein
MFCRDDNTKKRPVSDNPMSAGGRRAEKKIVKRQT